MGGVGLRRGRRDPDTLAVGDALDFWRVETFEPNRQLTLVAEMKIPGRAWLQFEVEPNSRGSVIKQTAIFDPAGLAGLLYWYALYPCIMDFQRNASQDRSYRRARARRSFVANIRQISENHCSLIA